MSAAVAAGIGATSAAIAAPAADAATSPPVVTGCGQHVSGSSGQPVQVDIGALLGTGQGATVTLGTIPSSGSTTLNPESVVQQQPNLVSALSGTVRTVLSGGCTITATAVNTVHAQTSKVTKPVTDAAKPVTGAVTHAMNHAGITHPSPSSSGGDTGSGGSQAPTHQATPGGAGGGSEDSTATPGTSTALPGVPATTPLYGQAVPGGVLSPASLLAPIAENAPGFATASGFPGLTNAPFGAQYAGQAPGRAPTGQVPGQRSDDPVRKAGNATPLALQADSTAGRFGAPLLAAVILVTGVTAGLVRAWVVKKAA